MHSWHPYADTGNVCYLFGKCSCNRSMLLLHKWPLNFCIEFFCWKLFCMKSDEILATDTKKKCNLKKYWNNFVLSWQVGRAPTRGGQWPGAALFGRAVLLVKRRNSKWSLPPPGCGGGRGAALFDSPRGGTSPCRDPAGRCVAFLRRHDGSNSQYIMQHCV